MSWHFINKPVRHCSAAEYRKIGEGVKRGDPAKIMSRGELLRFGKNPHKWLFSEPPESTAEMEFGDRVDCLWLRPDEFETEYSVSPETCKDGKGNEKLWDYKADARKAWREEQVAAGKAVITPAQLTEARLAVASLNRDTEAVEIKECSQVQMLAMAEWRDPDTGIRVVFKTLADLLPDPESKYGKLVPDLKTTYDASHDAWTNTVHNKGYAYQNALYTDVINAATGLEYDGCKHIILESEPPFEVTVRPLSEDFIIIGRNAYMSDLKRYCNCLAKGFWRGYDRAEIYPKPWML